MAIRKKKKDDGKKKGMFDSLEGFLAKHRNGLPSQDEMKDIADKIAEAVGGEVVKFKGGTMVRSVAKQGAGAGNSRTMAKFDGLGKALLDIGLATGKIKPYCKDAAGKDIREGALLKVPGNEFKKVLRLGFGFCELSNTVNMDVSDGYWFENEINAGNFLLKE